MPMDTGLKVIVYMTDIKFDQEDEITKGVYPNQILYYFYHNDRLVKKMSAAEAKIAQSTGNNAEYTLYLKPNDMNDESGVVRLMARDSSKSNITDQQPLVGSISLNVSQYFTQMPS